MEYLSGSEAEAALGKYLRRRGEVNLYYRRERLGDGSSKWFLYLPRKVGELTCITPGRGRAFWITQGGDSGKHLETFKSKVLLLAGVTSEPEGTSWTQV